MPAWPVTIVNRFFPGCKEHPVFAFHPFTGNATQRTVNF